MQYLTHLHSEIWLEDDKQEKQFLTLSKKKAMKDRFDKHLSTFSPLQSLVPTSSAFIESEDEDRKLLGASLSLADCLYGGGIALTAN